MSKFDGLVDQNTPARKRVSVHLVREAAQKEGHITSFVGEIRIMDGKELVIPADAGEAEITWILEPVNSTARCIRTITYQPFLVSIGEEYDFCGGPRHQLAKLLGYRAFTVELPEPAVRIPEPDFTGRTYYAGEIRQAVEAYRELLDQVLDSY